MYSSTYIPYPCQSPEIFNSQATPQGLIAVQDKNNLNIYLFELTPVGTNNSEFIVTDYKKPAATTEYYLHINIENSEFTAVVNPLKDSELKIAENSPLQEIRNEYYALKLQAHFSSLTEYLVGYITDNKEVFEIIPQENQDTLIEWNIPDILKKTLTITGDNFEKKFSQWFTTGAGLTYIYPPQEFLLDEENYGEPAGYGYLAEVRGEIFGVIKWSLHHSPRFWASHLTPGITQGTPISEIPQLKDAEISLKSYAERTIS